MVKKLIHAEGFVVLLAAIYIYSLNEFSWWMFFLLLLAPDLSMLAYLINQQIGTQIYNWFHTYVISILFSLVGVVLGIDVVYMLGLIWTAHIGMDRLVGYGLKYPSSFKETHIQKI
jgi:hypothetical protein